MSVFPNVVTSDRPHRITALDGVRGIAILLVMLIHFTERDVASGVANQIYTQIAGVGWVGVDLFFVLSGFLITGLLLEAKRSPHYFKNFYARRTLRIFPPYYACLIIWLVAVPLLLHPQSEFRQMAMAKLQREQLWYWTYLSNWRMGLDGEWAALGISVYWSLAIEEQFYLIWPAIVRVCRPAVLSGLCVVLIVVAFALRLAMVQGGAHPILVYVSTPTRMDTLAIGALLAIAARNAGTWQLAQRLATWVGPIALACLAAIWLWIGKFSEYDPLMQVVGFPLLALLFGSVIVRAVAAPAGSRLPAFLRLRVLRFFGKYSYAMYLLHLTIRAELVSTERAVAFVQLGGVAAQVALFAVSLAVTVLAAWLSWNLLEKHFLALKRHFPSEPAIPPALA